MSNITDSRFDSKSKRVLVSYKHPRKRKLEYFDFANLKEAEKASNEIWIKNKKYFKYGIH